MNPWEQFKAAIIGKRLQVIRREYDGIFDFGEGLTIGIGTLWRLRNEDRIILTSDDDGHQYGLPAPVDAEAAANEHLGGAVVVSLIEAIVIPDFTIQFSGGVAIDVIARSSGYECWQTDFGGATVVGICGG